MTKSARAWLSGLGCMLLLVALGLPTLGATSDRDGDGLRDAFERASDGLLDPDHRDTDRDGVIDSAEDSDGDRLGNLGEQRFRTLPGDSDSDGDGRPDGQEDLDRDGRSNALEQDRRPVPPGLRPSLAAAPEDIWAHQPDCGAHWGVTKPRRCRFGDADAPVTLAVVGDSKATMYMPAFIAAADRLGWRVVSLLKGACSPVLGTTNGQQWTYDRGRSCDRWRRNVIDWLGRSQPEVIVYAHSDDYGLVDRDGDVLVGDRKLAAWRQGARATVEALPPSSVVLWLGDAPNNDGNPVRCLADHPGNMSACVTRREPLARREAELALREGVAAGGGTFGTLQDQVCSYDSCPLVQGHVLVFRDEGHLTVTFTRRMAPSMQRLLAGALVVTP